jgi:hypothetical protein
MESSSKVIRDCSIVNLELLQCEMIERGGITKIV